MKITNTIMALIVIALLAFGTYKFSGIYHDAKAYSEMKKMETIAMNVFDHDNYSSMKENYEFVKGLPLVGDTL